MAWHEVGYFGEDPDFDALRALPQESLGYQYARHIIDNGLNKTIASDYRRAHNPNMTELVMDAIIDGWQRGRAARNLNYERWEERLAEPLEDLRREFGVTTATVNRLAAGTTRYVARDLVSRQGSRYSHFADT